LVILSPVHFADELVSAEELVATARAAGRRVLVEPAAVLRHASVHADFDIATTVDVLAMEADVERP
jgi:hypothetical protein